MTANFITLYRHYPKELSRNFDVIFASMKIQLIFASKTFTTNITRVCKNPRKVDSFQVLEAVLFLAKCFAAQTADNVCAWDAIYSVNMFVYFVLG